MIKNGEKYYHLNYKLVTYVLIADFIATQRFYIIQFSLS